MEQYVSKEPLVSVVIPCYNQARYLPQAIQSVLAQTYPEFEIIVVNDGSPDNIAQLIAPFLTNPRIRLHNQINQGLSAARNSGIKLARGEYFLFLDADDWLAPEIMEKLLEPLEGNKSCGLAYCDFYHYYEKTGELLQLSSNVLGSLEQDSLTVLWARCTFPVHAALLRREWLERAGNFNPDIRLLEDFDFWLRISLAGCPMRHVTLPLVFYRQHTASITSRATPEAMDEAYLKIRHYFIKNYPARVEQATSRAFQNLNAIIDKGTWGNNQLRLEIESAKEQYKLANAAFNEVETYALDLENELNTMKCQRNEAETYALSLEKEMVLLKQTQVEAETYALSLKKELDKLQYAQDEA